MCLRVCVMAVCVWAAAPLLCVWLCLCSLGGSRGEVLEFGGVSGQWGRFPVWNACCESILSFSVRTHSEDGLLLYLDDEGFCDFLELLLLRGKLRLRFSIFCAEPAEVSSGVAVSDGHWHVVRVKRDWRNTSLEVDGRMEGWAEVKSKRRDMTVFSHTFMGGVSPELHASPLRLTSPGVRDHAPFAGWLTSVTINGSAVVMEGSEGVTMGGDGCGPDHMCQNGGVCSVVEQKNVCDCTDTGYKGNDCSEEHYNPGLAHLMIGDQGKTYYITMTSLPVPAAPHHLPTSPPPPHPSPQTSSPPDPRR